MIIQDTRDKLLSLVDENIVRRVRTSLDDLDDRVVSFEENLFDGKGVTEENFATLHEFRKDGWNKTLF